MLGHYLLPVVVSIPNSFFFFLAYVGDTGKEVPNFLFQKFIHKVVMRTESSFSHKNYMWFN